MNDTDGPLRRLGAAIRRKLTFRVVQATTVLLLLLALCAFSASQTPNFLTWRNLVYNLLTSSAYLGIIACGMTFVMVAGGFDLSVASTTTVCSVVTVLMLKGLAGQPAWCAIAASILAAMLAGTALGAFNGACVSYVGVNPFVTTLSTMLIFRGIALILTGGGQSQPVPLALKGAFRQIAWHKINLFAGQDHRVTIPVLAFAAVFAISVVLLRLTRFGHYVYAVGGNENAAWLAGVNTALVKAATYAICGLTCALAAVIYTAVSNTAEASSNQGMELIVIAAVIVGGTPLGGGSGGLFFTLIGLLLMRVIENLLSHYGVGAAYRPVVRGGIILVVVTIDVLVRRKGKQGRR